MKLLALYALLAFSCGSPMGDRVGSLPSSYTPGGVQLRSEVALGTHKIVQIENSLRNTARKARCLGYSQELELSDYRVAVIAPETTRDGVGAIRYKEGYIAGMDHVATDTLILVDQPDLTDITEHEATHRVYRYNDRARHNATAVHEWGETDFLMPECK